MLRHGAPQLALAALWLTTSGCRDEIPPVERDVSMQAPAASPAEQPAATTGITPELAHEAGPTERPPTDPQIDRALDLIGSSKLRFIDQAADADSRPSEYTAEQFASMLRSKWDWIGYDITKLDPWLEEIASRSFKTNLPYLVVLADRTTSELRPWLQRRLDESEDP